MKIIAQLLRGQVVRHPARYLLTTLAIVAAAGVVIWVVSGYDALIAQFEDFGDEYLGRYQFVVAPAEVPRNRMTPAVPVPRDIISALAADEAVHEVDAVANVRITLKRPDRLHRSVSKAEGGRRQQARPQGGAQAGGGKKKKGGAATGTSPFGPPPSPTLVGTSATAPPYPLIEGRWIDANEKEHEAVISQQAAEQHRVQLGDRLQVEHEKQKAIVTVVGIVRQPRTLGSGGRGSPAPSRGPAALALYVPIAVAEQLLGKTPDVSLAQVKLRDDAEPSAFRARWQERLAQASPALMLMGADDVETDLEKSRGATSARNQAYSATGIALLAALFIIFTALSMGVHERARQFAVLRAVALTPRQVGALIILESLLLGLIGWLGGLGAGAGMLAVMSRAQPSLFAGGASLGLWCVTLSGACAIGGALLAAVLPAWRAMHISPLDVMNAPAASLSSRMTIRLATIGLALIAINPLLVFASPLQASARYGLYVAVGCSAMAIGFLLLVPAMIQTVERLLGPFIARLLALDPRLLASELSSNLWRTAGTCVALTLGLGLFVSTQIWGYSMLQPFVPGPWVPDLLVNFTTGSLPDEEFATVARIAGIRAESCLPLAVEQPMLARDYTRSAEHTSVTRQDNVIVIGLDPQRGLGGRDALLQLRFVSGDRESAAREMAAGRGCVIPDHFAQATGLTVGDSFAVVPPETPEQPVEYTIAGVVELPGWHWMTKFSGLRRRSGRSAAMIFADYQTVRKDFELPGTNFFWTQLERGAQLETIGPALQQIADRYPGERQPTNGQGQWTFGARNFGENVRLSTPDEVRGRITTRADGMIWGMSQLPLVTLAIAGLGVLNTVMASIRARLWNIGVLRAVGLTPFALARLILAESLLLGLVACALSLAFGILAGWCGAGMSQYVSFFGGLNPALTIPWKQLGLGLGLTLLLCVVAALWPALRVSRTEPLQLLRAGRAAM